MGFSFDLKDDLTFEFHLKGDFIPLFITGFRNWMNSMGVDPFVNNIYTDTCNGLILIQVRHIVCSYGLHT